MSAFGTPQYDHDAIGVPRVAPVTAPTPMRPRSALFPREYRADAFERRRGGTARRRTPPTTEGAA